MSFSCKEYYQAHKEKWAEYYKARRQKAPLYATWQQMLTRTGHKGVPKSHEIKNYIDRDIDVCDAWTNYREFESWCLSHGWKKGLQLDRINNDVGYEPDNCRFVTPAQNQHNRRDSPKVVYNGEMTILGDVYDIFVKNDMAKVPYQTASNRVKRLKWNVYDAITIPSGVTRTNK